MLSDEEIYKVLGLDGYDSMAVGNARAIEAAVLEKLGAQEPCHHSIADARNKVVKSGYICVKCGALFAAADHAPVQQEPVGRVIECAKRLVEHADFKLGGILSADSKAKDIPSNAISQVKARHLAALRDAIAAAPVQQEPMDAAGNPKPAANILESALVGALNQVKAWADSEAGAPLPREILMRVDAVLMTAEMRRTDIGKGLG